jgi:hypothetical protein
MGSRADRVEIGKEAYLLDPEEGKLERRAWSSVVRLKM